jgi:hypothetical protein
VQLFENEYSEVFPHRICLFQRGVETIQITEYLMAADAHIVNSAEKIDQVHKRLLVLIIDLAILQYSKFSGSLCSVPSGY